MSTAISTDNAPRDVEGLKQLKPHRRYSLALMLGVIQSGSPEEQGFISSSAEIQSQAIAQALAAQDAVNASQTGFSGPVTPTQVVVPQGMVVPTNMSAPPLPPAPPMPPPPSYVPQAAMQPQGQGGYAPPLPPAGAPSWQQPQQAGFQPPRAPLPPSPQAQVVQPPPQSPANGRSPSTAGDPKNTGDARVVPGMDELLKTLKGIREELDDVPGFAEYDELKKLLLAMKVSQSFIVLILLELASSSMEIEKQPLVGMIQAMSKSSEYQTLLAAVGLGAANEGKE